MVYNAPVEIQRCVKVLFILTDGGLYLTVHPDGAQVALLGCGELQQLPGPHLHRGELPLVVLADLPFVGGRLHPVEPINTPLSHFQLSGPISVKIFWLM